MDHPISRSMLEIDKCTRDIMRVRTDLTERTLREQIQSLAEGSYEHSVVDVYKACRMRALRGDPMPWE